MKTKLILLLSFLVLIAQFAAAQQIANSRSAQGNNIIPMPYKIEIKEKSIQFGNKVNISANLPDELKVADFLTSFFKSRNRTTELTSNGEAAIILRTIRPANKVLGIEGYTLKTANNKIVITANTEAGLFYGVQTLIQMLPTDKKAPLIISNCEILDKPAFAWRGTMLDVARHMLPVEYIKKHIDMMAMYKLNTLHLHLTDDQGWRIEIKKYPKLAEIASKRKETLIGWQASYPTAEDFKFDGKPYGGFYTQEQLRDIVKYAADRQITIVPEIEMPGHSQCVLAAYPELACKPGKYATVTFWGVFDDILCPTPETITFFENILDEVCAIFPGTYIHIGGDEVPKTRWKESPYIQELMKREGIDDVEKIQGWFNRQIEEYLKSKNRKLIGWDEILDGGISESAAIMSWRGENGGIAAANMGNEVVMSPGSMAMYWDHAYGDLAFEPDSIGRQEGNAPLSKIYAYNPVPNEIAMDKKQYILGVQANIWSEYIKSAFAHEYLTYPRMLALAEIAWTLPENKNWNDFVQRTANQYIRFDEKRINYRLPEPIIIEEQSIVDGNYCFKLFTPIKGAKIRFTSNGNNPGKTSTEYEKPIKLKLKRGETVQLMAITVTSTGKQSAPAVLELKRND